MSAKRLEQERERDLVYISELYLRGYTASQIAEKIGEKRTYTLTDQTIRNDLKEIRKRWLQAQLVNFNDAKALELQRLDALIEEYWEAWRRSQEDKEVEKTEDIIDTQKGTKVEESGEAGPINYEYRRARKYFERAGRDGSAVYLKGIQECIRMRAEILGLFAPDRLIVDWREQVKDLGVESEASQMFEQMVQQFAEALGEDSEVADDSAE